MQRKKNAQAEQNQSRDTDAPHVRHDRAPCGISGFGVQDQNYHFVFSLFLNLAKERHDCCQ
jgi:hypothetical protein